MAKNVELLLLETVENLGLVGDVVRVKPGFARNFLLPHGIAERPTPSRVESLKEQRAHAQAELAKLRSQREKLVQEIADTEVTLQRSCNDQGGLYGSVTQRDISDALVEAGYGVEPRAVRMSHPIRHIGKYAMPIQFDKDLRAEITVLVKADRELEGFTELGEPVETPETDEPEADEDRPRRRRRRDDDDRPEFLGL